MKNQLNSVEFFMKISRIHTIIARKLEWPMNGIGWSDFLILDTLNRAENAQMRQIDLAEAIGLTASGLTRCLLPMEKIGLVSRKTSEIDKRVTFVSTTEVWKQKFFEAREEAAYFFERMISEQEYEEFVAASQYIQKISNRIS